MLLLHVDKENRMITKLLPEQISKFWPIIKHAIEESLPPTVGDHPDKMNRILSSCLSGELDVWASYHKGESESGIVFEGIGLTSILYDPPSNTKSLLIYCMFGYEKSLETSWIEAFEGVSEYAKSKGCSRIVAYSSVPYIIERAKQFGGNTDYTFISFPLK